MTFLGLQLGSVARAVAILALVVTQRSSIAEQGPGSAIGPVFNETIPNIPGKNLIAVAVYYPPGGKTPAHRHAASAFVAAYVLSGAIRSQVDGGEMQVFNAGESWFEKPGAHHDVSENASSSEPAKLLKIFVVDSKDTNLTIIDGH
jgi:quercetin dioxygenase-like cupin family protein